MENGELYIVMELAELGDLARLINRARDRDQPLGERTIWKLFYQVRCSCVCVCACVCVCVRACVATSSFISLRSHALLLYEWANKGFETRPLNFSSFLVVSRRFSSSRLTVTRFPVNGETPPSPSRLRRGYSTCTTRESCTVTSSRQTSLWEARYEAGR